MNRRFVMLGLGGLLLGAPLACASKPHNEEAAPDWMLKGSDHPPHPMSDQKSRAFRDCTVDADCLVALNGCCDCANGGADIAINRHKSADFRKQFDCSTVHCNNEGSMVPCGSGAVACTDGLCRYTPRAEAPAR